MIAEQGDVASPRERKRAKANKRNFTELGLQRLKPPATGQELVWDTDTKGLSVLLSSGGTKTYRATFMLHGKPISMKLGRVGEMELARARKLTSEYRGKAEEGIDPRVTPEDRYDAVVDSFIEHYARPRQRTWDQTEYYLRKVCEKWRDRPIGKITTTDAYNLLEEIKREHPRKAAVTLAWIKTLWRWAWKRGLVDHPIMDKVEIESEKRVRERYYSDAEIKAIWQAAEKLPGHERDYVKLLLLLAPRKSELTGIRPSELKFDDQGSPTVWVTPHERTKSRKKTNGKRRVYTTPLPPLAQGIVRERLKRGEGGLLFEGRAEGKPLNPGTPLRRKLAKHGAPTDFTYHAVRHTVATWLENEGHSEFERGLVLNHSGSGVTAGYSHGYAMDLKLALLTKWANHIERLVQSEGTTHCSADCLHGDDRKELEAAERLLLGIT